MSKDRIFTLKDFNFNLPEEQIAQHPSTKREDSRLFVLNRKTNEYEHRMFNEIDKYLAKGDVLVLNNAKVIPARIYFNRDSGGLVEIVLTQRLSQDRWLVLSNRTKRLKKNEILFAAANKAFQVKIIQRIEDFLEIETSNEFDENLLGDIGEIPLPPYIKRKATKLDLERYQTVYAEEGVAAASPTAGLHFSNELIKKLTEKGVIFVYLTLHVSWGTFQPVRDNDLSKHKMHTELFSFPEESATEINRARAEGRRIIAVGTTSLRVLEATFKDGVNKSMRGETDIFIYPPYRIRSIDALITNFHTPLSTLLMLVSAFTGYDEIMHAYQAAITEKYRFFSYGDSMLIL